MTGRPLVSVVIPTYNRAHVICEAVDSVLAQTYPRVEVIVVDDGSTDDTSLKLKSYGKRIRVVSQSNAGPAIARNRGITLSNGDVIAFQDSDDTWHSTKLERQVALLEKGGNSVPCCLSNATVEGASNGEITSFKSSFIDPPYQEGFWFNAAEVLATRFILFNQTAAIRRDVLERIGGFDESLKYIEDYDLSLRIALEGPWAFIQPPLVLYRPGSPNSWAKRALEDEVRLKECEVKSFERILAQVNRRACSPELERLLKARLRKFRRLLTAAELAQTDSWYARGAANLIRQAERYQYAAFRRSPWFPKAKTREA